MTWLDTWMNGDEETASYRDQDNNSMRAHLLVEIWKQESLDDFEDLKEMVEWALDNADKQAIFKVTGLLDNYDLHDSDGDRLQHKEAEQIIEDLFHVEE